MRLVTTSKTEWLYLLLAVGGAVLPLTFLFRFISSEGVNSSLFFRQLFANNISALFAMDVSVSAIGLWLFVFVEGRRLKMTNLWVYVVCTVFVGVSLALPLFLLFRERQINLTLESATLSRL